MHPGVEPWTGNVLEGVCESLSIQDRWGCCSIAKCWRQFVENTQIWRITHLEEFRKLPIDPTHFTNVARVCATILHLEGYQDRFGEVRLSCRQQGVILPAFVNLRKAQLVVSNFHLPGNVNVSAWAAMIINARISLRCIEFRYTFDKKDVRHVHVPGPRQEFFFLGSVFPAMQRVYLELFGRMLFPGPDGPHPSLLRPMEEDEESEHELHFR